MLKSRLIAKLIRSAQRPLSLSLASTCLLVLPLWMVFPALAGPAADETPDIVIERCPVRFLSETELPALTSGRLTRVEVQANQTIAANTPLAQIDDQDIRFRQRELDTLRLELTHRLKLSECELETAKLDLLDAESVLEIDERLDSRGSGTVTPLKIKRSRLAVENAKNQVKEAQTLLDIARLKIANHERQVEELQSQLQRRRITSPSPGVVLEVMHQTGEWVDQGETFAKMARMDELRVSALVHESQLSPRHAVGVPVTIRWEEAGQTQTLRGTVDSVDPQIHDTGQFRLHINVSNRQVDGGWLLTPGRLVVVTLHASARATAQPSSASVRRLGVPRGTLQR